MYLFFMIDYYALTFVLLIAQCVVSFSLVKDSRDLFKNVTTFKIVIILVISCLIFFYGTKHATHHDTEMPSLKHNNNNDDESKHLTA